MKIVIIGAGPCGLGAAKRLDELSQEDWILLERESYPGGLSSSFVDKKGFTWDVGGHVLFSHYPEFDKMLEETCGGELLSHQRKSFIKLGPSRIPYPFQNNLHHLPPAKASEALSGLKKAPGGDPSMSLDRWLEATFGASIYQLFMRPYNQKVWATDLSLMASNWIAERISVVHYPQALKNIRSRLDSSEWGPNRTFRFPLRGGTGEIFRRLAKGLPQDRMKYNTEALRLDVKKRTLYLRSGPPVTFDCLINTMPLDELIRRAKDAPSSVHQQAERLRYSGTYVVGCGLEVPLSDDWTWMYFPESDVPFNRVTNFARYSPHNVAHGNTKRYCSFMCETSFSDTKPQEKDQVMEATWKGLYDSGLAVRTAKRASEYVIKVPYAYPVPTLDRDEALRHIQAYLMKNRIYSRGRFGAWLYEVGNMDHSFKQGRDVVDYILRKKEEKVWKL
ncbi:MAG: protoporphyrinogen/coproporphyrinogen oxidase [Candidatus Aminicenantes bacterium]